ncbi:hypothetical protein [Actinoplanes friuliensis]|uniref:DUF4350 domain-containing protein n=1 Tax=Actinoplanes friuliensis DSM 7358 TaxID=1246995 RepID=U5W570_9ACTN|nr:hypothetical protein [Actinoplanes friuliensis]AGZ44294.1 hypothetical protein AFR_30170 [Actinoplanes friuliensis DSM 7358]
MADRTVPEWVRWVALAVAVGILVIFLVAQRQSVDVSYGRSPSTSTKIDEPSAGEPAAVTVPSVEEMTALVAARDVVRLPGSIAFWDEAKVRAAAPAQRILVAPPGLDKAERARVHDVENATIRIVGTEVSGGLYQASGSTITSWRAQFATGDVTSLLLTLLAADQDQPEPADVDTVTRRDPTAAELATVVADLRRTKMHLAEGATLTGIPAEAGTAAFPSGNALYVAFPQQKPGQPLPRYGPALAATFPGTPIVVMYGSWIEYDGPEAADFAELTAASYYGRFGDLLSRSAYPQRNVLAAWLNRVADVRYSGLFDRPLPYRPLDPLRVSLPVLPWLFAACVAVFLVLSVRSARGRRPEPGPVSTPARLAGLTGLAVEMSALTDEPGVTRGITKLVAARDALGEGLPDQHVRELLDDAESELDEAARLMPFDGFRPADYLKRLA